MSELTVYGGLYMGRALPAGTVNLRSASIGRIDATLTARAWTRATTHLHLGCARIGGSLLLDGAQLTAPTTTRPR
ncbi:hypothetical protein [Streptomyces griseorubiginosus]|uniref:hypothetical protein n=1 Tax=Streptomyces griseorubiginosus TaxID=67304 RepID=UPI001AD769B5|nr:hypothetical protein [Streptomyces griseorubiginosus]